MEHSKSSTVINKNKHKTLFSLSVYTVFLICLLSLLAWFLLLIWFSYRLYFFGHDEVNNQIYLIQKACRGIIEQRQFILFNKLFSLLHAFNNEIQQTIGIVSEKITFLADKFGKTFYLNMDNPIFSLLTGTTEIVITRLFLFAMNIPFFICISFLAIVDGLSQRDIRKYQGARESTLFFHKVKKLIGKTFCILFLFYMAIPAAISPNILLIPLALVFGLFLTLSIKNYKKYL